MRILVRVPKGLIPVQQVAELERTFAVRTHLHLKHLGKEWKGELLTADPVFESTETDRAVVAVTLYETPFSNKADSSQKAFCELLEISMSEILDALEVKCASVEVTAP